MFTTLTPLGRNIDGTGESPSINSAILLVFRRFAPSDSIRKRTEPLRFSSHNPKVWDFGATANVRFGSRIGHSIPVQPNVRFALSEHLKPPVVGVNTMKSSGPQPKSEKPISDRASQIISPRYTQLEFIKCGIGETSLAGKRVVVTAGADGIGLEIRARVRGCRLEGTGM